VYLKLCDRRCKYINMITHGEIKPECCNVTLLIVCYNIWLRIIFPGAVSSHLISSVCMQPLTACHRSFGGLLLVERQWMSRDKKRRHSKHGVSEWVSQSINQSASDSDGRMSLWRNGRVFHLLVLPSTNCITGRRSWHACLVEGVKKPTFANILEFWNVLVSIMQSRTQCLHHIYKLLHV